MPENPNRGPWIIAGAIVLAAVMVVAVMLLQRAQEDACKNWQAEVQEMQALLPRGYSSTSPDFMGPEWSAADAATQVETERPDGCALP